MAWNRSLIIYFFLFSMSGFTGLIYESIWSHYLKLFLGHAAYAQALVLAIFMGGMAVGAWFASKYTGRWKNLIMAYAVIEGLIGVFGIVFQPLFQAILAFSYDHIIPGLGSGTGVQVYKWSVGTLLILPQSILLGMTFPLMSNGIIRLFPLKPGHSLSMLYFTNSIGAAMGVLISGFVLIKMAGLPGTILTAGIINILIAIIVYRLAKEHPVRHRPGTETGVSGGLPILILCAAFITGMASFIYEIAWIRMLSMVLGTSTHAFELMLSAFITGLAFGGLWIRRHIDTLSSPVTTAGVIQILMGILALSTIVFYNYTFDMMSYFLSALDRTDEGYRFFNFSSHFIALVIMLPPTFLAGMTLPLFTFILLKQGYGEKSVGEIYASNTLGSITGVVFTIFIGMPVLGLKGSMLLGSGIDIALGLVLLATAGALVNRKVISALVTSLLIAGAIGYSSELDVRKMSSSVYRTGFSSHDMDTDILFQKDGKTASVHVLERPDGSRIITTNGKPDAAMNMHSGGERSLDEPTMVLLAALPVAIKPEAEKIANIGMGSGLTTHTLLASPNIEQVDTIEIEPAMIEGARHFLPRVERAFADPRSRIHIEDAKTFFSIKQKKYDIIISEPSNPWVSGASSLFTDEFYNHVKNYLEDDGLLVQWIQAYEINISLVISVLKALRNNFTHYSLYATSDSDLIIIAKNESSVDLPTESVFDSVDMKKELSLVGINNVQDMMIRFLVNESVLDPLIRAFSVNKNSDYFPILDLNASKAMFKKENILALTRVRLNNVPITNILLPEIDISEPADISKGIMYSASERAASAQEFMDYLRGNHDNKDFNSFYLANLELLIQMSKTCDAIHRPELWITALHNISYITLPYLAPDQLDEIWRAVTPECEDGLNEIQNNWLNLLRHIGHRNTEGIRDVSSRLMRQKYDQDTNKQQFLFTAQLTSLIRLQAYDAAIQLWDEQLHDLYKGESIPLELQMLFYLASDKYGHLQKDGRQNPR